MSRYTVVVLLSLSFILSVVANLWLVPTLLDESYITRTLLVVFSSVLLAADIAIFIACIIVQSNRIKIFTQPYIPYFLYSVVYGVLMAFFAGFFWKTSSDVDILDTSTFADPVNYRLIFIYRNIITVGFCGWLTKMSLFLSAVVGVMNIESEDDVLNKIK